MTTSSTGRTETTPVARPPAAGASYGGVHEGDRQRHQHVEVELHGQRPGRAVGPEDVLVAVDVRERQVQHQVLPVAGQVRVGERPDDQHHRGRTTAAGAPFGGTAPPSRVGRPARRARCARPAARARSPRARRTSPRTARCRASCGGRRPTRARRSSGAGAVVLVGVEGHHGECGEAAQPGEWVGRARGCRRPHAATSGSVEEPVDLVDEVLGAVRGVTTHWCSPRSCLRCATRAMRFLNSV